MENTNNEIRFEVDEPSDEFDRMADERITLSELDVSDLGIMAISFLSVALMELNMETLDV